MLLWTALCALALAQPGDARPGAGAGALSAAPSDAASRPWRESPRFGLSAAELLAAAELVAAPDGASVFVLYQDTSYSFEADGRLTQSRYWIYQIKDSAALADWSTSQVRWSKSTQERPAVRARVVTAGGEEHWLDAATASRDRRAPEGREGLHGDRWLREAPLPAVSVGAVVEEEIVLRDVAPVFGAGTAHRHYTALLAPTLDGRLTLKASTRLALRYGARLMPPGARPQTSVADGTVRVVFDFADLPPVEAPEDGMPGHRPRFPQVAFSTGRSWQRVAGELSARVEAAVREADLEVLGSVVRGAGRMDRRARIDAILQAVRRAVPNHR
ncbi:MAG: DUF3857 domain-containing protein, partial [Acidobacteriota bacterium]